MDREQIEKHLTAAAGSIEAGTEKIARQQAVVTALERDGHDASAAYRLLNELQQEQFMHFADRDRLLMALAKLAIEGTIARTGTA